MKKVIVILLIGTLAIFLSIKKPIKVQSKPTQITKQSIGLPTQAVKDLRTILLKP